MASPAWPAPMMTAVVRMAALELRGPSAHFTSTVTLVGLVMMS